MPTSSPRSATRTERRRILFVANETLASDLVVDLVERYASEADVLVVAPALQGRLAFWTSADAAPRRAAEGRLARCLALLGQARVRAEGLIGDADPLLAIEDALRLFAADEIVIATHPECRSNWLARNVVRRAGERFWHPIHHVVVETQPARVAA